MQTSTSIARTILEQLGGSRFLAMTGAKDMIDLGNGLQVRVGRGAARGINKVRIVLTTDDLYELDYYRVGRGGLDVHHIARSLAVPAESLRTCFTDITGFDCAL